MKTSTRILGLLSTAVIGLTLTSCGGGGGGGSSSSSTGNNDTNTGLSPASLATQKWTIEEKSTYSNAIGLEVYDFIFSSDNKVIISVGSTSMTGIGASRQYFATYSYKKTGANTATLTITGDLPNASISSALNEYVWTSNIGDHVFNLNFSSKFNASATTSVPNLKNNYGFRYVEG